VGQIEASRTNRHEDVGDKNPHGFVHGGVSDGFVATGRKKPAAVERARPLLR
jgi:hypothetical protein